MKSLRRFYIPDATYFITVVTYNRAPVLLKDVDLFWRASSDIRLLAWVIMEDHFHAILDPTPHTISEAVHRFKLRYARNIPAASRPPRIWQNRFWDHVIRDEQDLNRHLDYIHFNPVHHRKATDPFAYKHSSLAEWYAEGAYEKGWGKFEETDELIQFGEPSEDVG
jgi:putative transposase